MGGILTECNDFGGEHIDIEAFERFELRRGPGVLAIADGVMGGMVITLRERSVEPVPLLFASTSPGGPLTFECYETLRHDLLDALRTAGPVHAVLLALHGAAVADGVDDIEGDLLEHVRGIVGPSVPIVATLDLHAHVTEQMVSQADGLVAWETYPHQDSYTTGERGASLLVDVAQGRVRPTMAMAKVPVLTGAVNGSTEGEGPFADLMRRAKQLEMTSEVLSTSMFLVQPFLDRPGLGSGALVITDDDIVGATSAATDLAAAYWRRRFDLEPETSSPHEAVVKALDIEGAPVILAEAADACGGGAAGDSIATIAALLEHAPDIDSIAPVVDPDAAARCHAAGLGAELELRLGHQLDPRWGEPIEMTVIVERLTDGMFTYDGGIWDGVVGEMGPTAVVHARSLRILISSFPTYEWKDEQFRSVGIDATEMRFIVAKNPMNFRMAYPEFAEAIIIDSPGPTPVTCRSLPYQRLARPFFPLDEDIDGLRPLVFTNPPTPDG